MDWLKRKAIDIRNFEESREKVINSLFNLKNKIIQLQDLMKEHNKLKDSLGDPFDVWGYEFITELGVLDESQDEIDEAIKKLKSLKLEFYEEKQGQFHEDGIVPYFNPSIRQK